MSTFQFDTSGTVEIVQNDGKVVRIVGIIWSDLKPLYQGYFTAIAREAWESLDQIQKDRLDHFGPIAFSDFSPELVGRGMRDCSVVTDRIFAGTRMTEEDGRRVWEHRAVGFPGPLATDLLLRDALPPLRLVIAEDGLLHAEERRP